MLVSRLPSESAVGICVNQAVARRYVATNTGGHTSFNKVRLAVEVGAVAVFVVVHVVLDVNAGTLCLQPSFHRGCLKGMCCLL